MAWFRSQTPHPWDSFSFPFTSIAKVGSWQRDRNSFQIQRVKRKLNLRIYWKSRSKNCTSEFKECSPVDKTKMLSTCMSEAAKLAFKRTRKQPHSFPRQEWYDDECKSPRRKIRCFVKQRAHLEQLECVRQEHCTTLRRKERAYEAELSLSWETLARQDPYKFWKATKQKPTPLKIESTDIWQTHYSKLLKAPENWADETADTPETFKATILCGLAASQTQCNLRWRAKSAIYWFRDWTWHQKTEE